MVIYKDEMYNMPFNINIFSKMWGVKTPTEAKVIIDEQLAEIKGEPQNLEEQAISTGRRKHLRKISKGLY